MDGKGACVPAAELGQGCSCGPWCLGCGEGRAGVGAFRVQPLHSCPVPWQVLMLARSETAAAKIGPGIGILPSTRQEWQGGALSENKDSSSDMVPLQLWRKDLTQAKGS